MKYAKLIIPMLLLSSYNADANMFEVLYDTGKKNNLLLKAQNALQDSSKQQEDLAFANLLPRVALLGSWNYQQQKQRIDSDSYLLTIPDRRSQLDGFGYQVTVTQALFNLPAYHTYQRGREVSVLADLEKLRAKSTFIQAFSVTYLEIVADWQRLSNINETLKAYTAQRNLIAKQYETGFVKPSDLQQAEASLATLQTDAIVVKNRITVSFKRLELLLQSDVKSLRGLVNAFENNETLNKPLIDFATRYKSNLDYRVANANVKIAERDLQTNSTLSMPSVGASLSYSKNQLENTFDYQSANKLHQDGLTFGVQVTIPLYAGGADTHRKQQAAYVFESAKYQQQFIELEIQQSIRTNYLNLKTGLESLKSRAKAVTASQVALDNSNLEYRTGIGQYTDVRTSQDRLFEQTNSLILDKINLIGSYFNLAVLTGEDPDTTVKNMKQIFTGEVINNEE